MQNVTVLAIRMNAFMTKLSMNKACRWTLTETLKAAVYAKIVCIIPKVLTVINVKRSSIDQKANIGMKPMYADVSTHSNSSITCTAAFRKNIVSLYI